MAFIHKMLVKQNKHKKQSKSHNLETESNCNCMWHSYQVLGKILSKGQQLFLCATHLYLIYIPIKLHEDIMNSEWVMECTRMKIHKISIKIQSKCHNS